MRLSALIVGLLLLPVTLAWADDSEHDRLDKGEILITSRPVDGSSIPEITIRAVINAPPEHVWAVVDQCGNYRKTIPRIKESKELSRIGHTVRCRVVLSSPGPIRDLVAVTEAEHLVEPGKSWVRSWKLVSGDYKHNVGSWTLTPFDGNPKRTMLVYTDHSEPTIWVPDWLENFAVKKGLPSLIEKLRSEVK